MVAQAYIPGAGCGFCALCALRWNGVALVEFKIGRRPASVWRELAGAESFEVV